MGVARDLKVTYQNWLEDEALLLAASVAYYAALSFFPLVYLLLAFLGIFFEYTNLGYSAEEQLLSIVAQQLSPTISESIEKVISNIKDTAGINGPVGFATLLLTACGIFFQFDVTFSKIWNVEKKTKGVIAAVRRIVSERLKAFLVLFSLGGMIVFVFVAGIILQASKPFLLKLTGGLIPVNAIDLSVTFSLNLGIFLLIYRYLSPKVVSWKAAAKGAFLAASLWTLGRWLLTAAAFGDKYTAYGLIGTFIGILLWIFAGTSIIFLGAEYVQVKSAAENAKGNAIFKKADRSHKNASSHKGASLEGT